MRAFRTTRISALRVTAVAASGVLAMAVLTGCGDDKDDNGSNPFGKDSKAPTASATASDKSSDSPTKSPTATKRPTSSSSEDDEPTSTSTDDMSINRIDLKVGDCIDFDTANKMSKTSCSGPHDGETVGIFDADSSINPVSTTFEKDLNTKCNQYVDPVIRRQPNASQLNSTFVYPDPSTWYTSGDRTVQCFVIMDDDSPLPAGKLK
jgi:hypothetical protein